MHICCKLIVFFEDPFWVGVFERTVEDQYEVSRYVFRAEPKDYEVYDFLLENYYNLRFSNPISGEKHVEKSINPKKLQKKISKELEKVGVGTKAQVAMKLQYEANKAERKKVAKELKEEIQKRKFDLKQQKKKEKIRGH